MPPFRCFPLSSPPLVIAAAQPRALFLPVHKTPVSCIVFHPFCKRRQSSPFSCIVCFRQILGIAAPRFVLGFFVFVLPLFLDSRRKDSYVRNDSIHALGFSGSRPRVLSCYCFLTLSRCENSYVWDSWDRGLAQASHFISLLFLGSLKWPLFSFSSFRFRTHKPPVSKSFMLCNIQLQITKIRVR